MVKIIMITLIFITSIIALSKTGIVSFTVFSNLEQRLFSGVFSSEFAEMAIMGRSLIYESAYNDFLASPIWGHGFGHTIVFFDFWNTGNFIENSVMDNSYINIIHKFGLVGLTIFILFLMKIFFTGQNKCQLIRSEDDLYIRGFRYAFPFICIASLNIDILYSYPEVIILSLFLSKVVFCHANTFNIARRAYHI